MNGVPDKCLTEHQKTQFSVEEPNSATVIFHNPDGHRIEEVQVDDCVFDGGDGKRCDYFLNVTGANKSIFVELKGGNVEDAILQLEATTDYFGAVLKKKVIWIIAHSDNPRFDTTKQVFEDKIRSKHHAKPIVGVSPLEYYISSPPQTPVR